MIPSARTRQFGRDSLTDLSSERGAASSACTGRTRYAGRTACVWTSPPSSLSSQLRKTGQSSWEGWAADEQEAPTSRISTVLALTDFSTQAGVAVARAALLAAQHGARLRLLHVVGQPWLGRLCARARIGSARVEVDERVWEAGKALGNFARRLATSWRIEADWKVLEGSLLHQVLTAAVDADLVVVGHRGCGFLGPYVQGSMASRLLACCPSPLLVVKRSSPRPYRRVLVPVDLSSSSPASLAAALRLAPRSEVRLLHALRNDYEENLLISAVPEHVTQDLREMIFARARGKMVELAARFGEQGANVHVSLEFAEILEMIVRHEARLPRDLVVVRAPQPLSWSHLRFGGLARSVLSRGQCDVLLIPARQRSRERARAGPEVKANTVGCA